MLHIYKKEELIRQLEQLHTPKGAIVLMHSSLRSIGKVEGAQKACWISSSTILPGMGAFSVCRPIPGIT